MIEQKNEKIVYGSLITRTKCYNCIHFPLCFAQKSGVDLELASENDCCYYQPKLPIDSVVLLKEEYEKLKSLYDSQKGVYMTSSIGNLPLTVESLRRAVDKITELDKTRSELLELNEKYCEEIKKLNQIINRGKGERI